LCLGLEKKTRVRLIPRSEPARRSRGGPIERGPLDLEERPGKTCDVLVKASAQPLHNRVAERLRCGLDPAAEKATPFGERALFCLNEMTHHVAQTSDVILRLGARRMARKTELGEVRAQR
jgi:hypothetical protein